LPDSIINAIEPEYHRNYAVLLRELTSYVPLIYGSTDLPSRSVWIDGSIRKVRVMADRNHSVCNQSAQQRKRGKFNVVYVPVFEFVGNAGFLVRGEITVLDGILNQGD
jgi:hypothetical protein